MRRVLAIYILAAPGLLAQSTVTGSRTVQGSWDASGASATKPAKAGATLPGTCFSGEFFFNTAAGSGQNVYLCNPNNTWSPANGGGGVTSVFGRSGTVTAATGDYLAAQVTNAVDATASYSNPVWISALAWAKLTGIPATFAPAAHNLLSATHGDTIAASVTRGALISGQGASPTWSILALGATSHFLRSNGTDLIYSAGPAAGAGACSAGQVMTAGNSDAAPTCSAPAYSWLTGVPAFNYQNVQSNTANQTQRANLNFSPQFSLADSGANNSTTITLAATIAANTTGNAATATALAATPSQCGANSFATGVAATGNANCAQPGFSNLTGVPTFYYQTVQANASSQTQRTNLNFSPQFSLADSGANNSTTVTLAATIAANTTGNAATATALAAAPSQCGANTFATGIAASGNATCAQPGYSNLTGVPSFYYQTVQANASSQTQRANLNFSPQFSLADSGANNSTTVTLAATIAANTTGNAATATALAAAPSQCGANNFATGVAASGNATCAQPGFANLSGSTVAAQIPANLRARAIGTAFSGGGTTITAGLVNYFTVPFACTVSAWSMTLDTGTATIDVWKVATGTAIPTASNTITASATPAISSGTALHSATLTGWTTSVAANDIIAFQVKSVTSANLASLILECDQ